MNKYHKKQITFFMLGCLCLLFTACLNIPGENIGGSNRSHWSIYNNTNYKLSLFPYTDLLEPNETASPYSFDVYDYNDISFTRYINGSNYSTVELFLEGQDEPIRIWKIEDIDQPGKQFFNEKSWIKTIENDGYVIRWTFVIEQEDIG